MVNEHVSSTLASSVDVEMLSGISDDDCSSTSTSSASSDCACSNCKRRLEVSVDHMLISDDDDDDDDNCSSSSDNDDAAAIDREFDV